MNQIAKKSSLWGRWFLVTDIHLVSFSGHSHGGGGGGGGHGHGHSHGNHSHENGRDSKSPEDTPMHSIMNESDKLVKHSSPVNNGHASVLFADDTSDSEHDSNEVVIEFDSKRMCK